MTVNTPLIHFVAFMCHRKGGCQHTGQLARLLFQAFQHSCEPQ